MKPLLFTLSIFTIMASAVFSLTGCNGSGAGDKGPMSFYTVPLVCFAAPEIGCGSMTKPLFMAEQEEVIRPLLAKYNIDATLVGEL
jgi:hypothetical protein